MDREKIRMLRTLIDQNLKELGERENVVFNAGNCTYRDGEATFKLNVREINEYGEVFDKQKEDFKKWAHVYGLEADDMSKTFELNGEYAKIIGLNGRAHKYPIIVESESGKKYKMSKQQVKRLLLKEAFIHD